MKKLKVLSVWVCAAAFCASVAPIAAYAAQPATESTSLAMYRLYNPNSGEHFYTADANERKNVLAAGWNDEGIGWYAPKVGQDVYRLYNKNGGEHHYTLSLAEKNNLVRAGWTYEGVGWKSAAAKEGVPLYRQYNPNAFANNHNYTTSSSEKNHLISLGWKDEGIGWYGVNQQRIKVKVTIDDDDDPKTPNVEKTVEVNPGASPLDALKATGAKVTTGEDFYGNFDGITSINGVKNTDRSAWFCKVNNGELDTIFYMNEKLKDNDQVVFLLRIWRSY